MTGGHHPCGTIEHRTEIVTFTEFGFAGRIPIRTGNSSARCAATRHPPPTRRGERGAHTVPGVLEQPAAVPLDRPTQHLVVGGQRHPHAIGVGFPPTGRTLNIGE